MEKSYQRIRLCFCARPSLLDRAGNTLGALTILAHEIDAFNNEEVLLLTELASDLSFGIVSLRMRSERDLALNESQAYQRKLERVLKTH